MFSLFCIVYCSYCNLQVVAAMVATQMTETYVIDTTSMVVTISIVATFLALVSTVASMAEFSLLEARAIK